MFIVMTRRRPLTPLGVKCNYAISGTWNSRQSSVGCASEVSISTPLTAVGSLFKPSLQSMIEPTAPESFPFLRFLGSR